MESFNASGHLYLNLHQNGQEVSGTLAYEDDTREVAILKAELHGDQLTFEVHDNPTRIVKFRLTVTASALNGEARYEDRVAKVALSRP